MEYSESSYRVSYETIFDLKTEGEYCIFPPLQKKNMDFSCWIGKINDISWKIIDFWEKYKKIEKKLDLISHFIFLFILNSEKYWCNPDFRNSQNTSSPGISRIWSYLY